ncbi:neuroglian isoform X5 [Lepeophtheirus salmonis]|uniref:neuroglian isoform X5 n=1 Tax=Lepeophtheirus salmonis TaxID=72036 RepID=UPI003AF40AF4
MDHKSGMYSFLILCSILPSSIGIVQSPPRMIKQPPTDELLFQVKSRQDENDKPFIIECEAEGEPAPMYRWEKNGEPYDWQVYDERISQQPGRGTFLITKPRDEEIGQYQCFATNEWGTATSNSVYVRKSELNNFVDEPPKTKTVEEGEPFGIPCNSPTGWPKPSVYWLKMSQNWHKTLNSSRITVDPEGTLWFSNITKEDSSEDFLYACSASSYFRNEYKVGNKVHLQVIQSGSNAGLQNKREPVFQYANKRSEIALRGKEMKLWCIFGGTPLPEIRWRKQGGPLPPGRTTLDNYGKTLVIKHVDFEDAGDYTCEASNGVGIAKSYSISIEVHARPRFIVEPEIMITTEGESVDFLCQADGYPTPSIQWIYNGAKIEKAPPHPNRFITPDRITITNVSKSDTGNYGCNASNVNGYVYKDVYVNVLDLPPEITVPPEETAQTVDGKAMTMKCETFGAPKPIVKWFHNNEELTGGRYKVQDSGDLLIQDVKFFDAGNYTCKAENKFGKASASGTLTVKEHTRISTGPKDYEVEAGDSATFRCNAVYDSELELDIHWLKNGKLIDFDIEPRFIQSSDQSLTITKTTELDSGQYTCLAKSSLDSAQASASLIVQDVPNPPSLLWVNCNSEDAVVTWAPMGDNRAPILNYKMLYNTSFTPDTWEVATDTVPASDTSFKVSMSPWTNYTFKVIARNQVGDSFPSGHSETCLTPERIPFKNPDNVEGRGTSPNNLVIYWTPMPQIEHNAPKFQYRVYWKKDEEDASWIIEDIADWRVKELVIDNQPTYSRYQIKVVAHNRIGEAKMKAKPVIGWSGENQPSEAPLNFTLLDVVGPRSAYVSWDPVSLDSINGDFKGYKIQTWTNSSGEEKFREIPWGKDTTEAFVQSFKPFSLNYARVLAFNGAYNGPPSNIIEVRTGEGLPGPVDMLECFPMGSSALLLAWNKPEEVNGILRGYRIYYKEVNKTHFGPEIERYPKIRNPSADKAKLAGLKPHQKYRVIIRAETRVGQGMRFYTECNTNPQALTPPSRPRFTYSLMNPENGQSRVKVTWKPRVEGNPGSHFYVQYKKSMDTTYLASDEELNEDSVVIRGLDPGYTYDFRVVAVDGVHETPSDPLPVYTYASLPIVGAADSQSYLAHSGWFIGMLLAIIFLIFLCIIVAIIKRNRGGKYAVSEHEAAHGRKDYDDAGFPEYTQPLDDRNTRPPRSTEFKPPMESDNDSIADYADGENTDFPFDEDGSFIGQYGSIKRKYRKPSSYKDPSNFVTSLTKTQSNQGTFV